MNPSNAEQKQVLKNITDQITLQHDFQAGRMMGWARESGSGSAW